MNVHFEIKGCGHKYSWGGSKINLDLRRIYELASNMIHPTKILTDSEVTQQMTKTRKEKGEELSKMKALVAEENEKIEKKIKEIKGQT